jgi:hypothetical protein
MSGSGPFTPSRLSTLISAMMARRRSARVAPTLRSPCAAAAAASGHADRDRAEEVALADVDAAVAKDRVRGGQMEIEIREDEMVEESDPFMLPLLTGPSGNVISRSSEASIAFASSVLRNARVFASRSLS